MSSKSLMKHLKEKKTEEGTQKVALQIIDKLTMHSAAFAFGS